MQGLALSYQLALVKVARAARVVFGTSDDVRPLADVQADLSPPETWTADVVLERLCANGLQFRANYSRLLVAWAAVCVVRHPVGAVWLVAIAVAPFHALVVRRGVVHLALPAASVPRRQLTLMYPQLHASLALGCAIAVLLVGRTIFVLSLLLPPAAVAAAHAVLREPPSRSAVQQRATELSGALHAALRGDDGDDDELEGGAHDFDEPPPRSEEMARRVEQIRAKYRPPAPTSAKKRE